MREPLEQDWRSTLTLREEKRAGKPDEKGLGFGTLGRNKERKMEQLRAKLHTDEELRWLDHGKTLREQSVIELFFFDFHFFLHKNQIK